MPYDTIEGADGTEDIALVCDADSPSGDVIYYDMNSLQELAECAETGDIMEVHCFKQMPNRFLVTDTHGVTVLCNTREAAEKIAESTVIDHDDDEA